MVPLPRIAPLAAHARFVIIAGLVCTSGCTTVLGTRDLEPCEVGECGGGASQGGGGESGTGGSGATGGATTSGGGGGGTPGCFDITVTIPSGVTVRVDTTPESEMVQGSTPVCAPAGPRRLRAYCGNGGGDKVVVDWGSASGFCATPADECNFELNKPETFNVTGATCP